MKFTQTYVSNPNPATSYAEALERIERLRADDTADIDPACHLCFLTHDEKMDRVIVFFHGYTACPDQFHKLGEKFHELGYNVLIPRVPLHGLKDRLTSIHAGLTTQTLVTLADETIDIAQGLGQRVSVMGLSMGGVMTAWVAQNRAGVERAMLISPALGFHVVPFILTRLIMWLNLVIPNRFGWWDPQRQAELPSPPYVYPRYATRAVAQFLRLGFAVQQQARKAPPAACSILVVTNGNDQHVNHRATTSLVKLWRKNGYTNLRTCEFTPEQELFHDFIDPAIVGEKLPLVYPVLIDLMTDGQTISPGG